MAERIERALDRVYPRACGGTAFAWWHLRCAEGLSPRVRGNRSLPGVADVLGGSIPARAGEPTAVTRTISSSTVYPRACGGTVDRFCDYGADTGLSPRVRGNPGLQAADRNLQGSIPARAGEPITSPSEISSTGVYPRACGGTVAPVKTPKPTMGLSPRVRGNRLAEP